MSSIKIPRIQILFDGETCQVSGHESGTLHGAVLDFENMGDSDAHVITVLLKEGVSPDEIFQSFQAGSTELPDGTFTHARSRSVSSGGNLSGFGTKFYEGNYAVLCVDTAAQTHYLGGWFTYE